MRATRVYCAFKCCAASASTPVWGEKKNIAKISSLCCYYNVSKQRKKISKIINHNIWLLVTHCRRTVISTVCHLPKRGRRWITQEHQRYNQQILYFVQRFHWIQLYQGILLHMRSSKYLKFLKLKPKKQTCYWTKPPKWCHSFY